MKELIENINITMNERNYVLHSTNGDNSVLHYITPVGEKPNICCDVFIKENNAIIAYLRVFEKEGVRIGRVLSVKRRLGFGTQVMREGIRVAQEKYNAAKILIEAQVYAKEMYEKLGFVQTSQEFVEDGIPHIKMELRL